jgi:hydrogenase expression/formation protein HypC
VSCDPHSGCITCGDVGIEMRVIAVDEPGGLATCDGGGARREVETALVGDVAPGDVLLVHADVALTRVPAA